MPKIVDTTIRLLSQDPLAGKLPTGEVLRIAEILDRAGFDHLEVSGGGVFDSAVRRAVESPWERIRAIDADNATLTVDPTLGVVLDHKAPVKPQMTVELKNAAKMVQEEASRRDEKYKQLADAEKNKSKVLEAKFQELFKKAKDEPIEKPLKDIDLD